MKKLLFLLCSWVSVPLIAQVTVHVDERAYYFPQAVKLSYVLETIPHKPLPYWAHSALFRLKEATPEKDDFNQHLTALRAGADSTSPLYQALSRMQSEVMQWRIHERIPVTIDIDLARLVGGKNPTVTDGEYILTPANRHSYVYIYGAVQSPGNFELQQGMSLAEFVKKAQPISAANRDFLYVVDPKGNIEKIGIAYWNAKPFSLAPGSQVLVPFRSVWWSADYDILHQLFLKLASNRVIE